MWVLKGGFCLQCMIKVGELRYLVNRFISIQGEVHFDVKVC